RSVGEQGRAVQQTLPWWPRRARAVFLFLPFSAVPAAGVRPIAKTTGRLAHRSVCELERRQEVASSIEVEPQADRADLEIFAPLESGQTSLRDEKPGHVGCVRDLHDAQIIEVVR